MKNIEGSDTATWVSPKRFDDTWAIEKELPGGGQGRALVVTHKSDGRRAFVKVLKSQQDHERRARFFREASAYDTFLIPGLPKLIESNAHLHKDISVKLYMACELIQGPTLTNWREQQAEVTLTVAVDIAIQLLEILEHCHAKNCVHRDIKPDNIILEQGDSLKVRLLDFGLSYHEIGGKAHETLMGQELGNRFLRLPELSAGSPIKQDPRSDVSFVAGILYYVLTGFHPDTLSDAEGKMPHQRTVTEATLRTQAGPKFHKLLTLFDQAFNPQINYRYPHGGAMRAHLHRLLEDHPIPQSADDAMKAMMANLDIGPTRQLAETTQRLEQAEREITSVFEGVIREFNGKLERRSHREAIKNQTARNIFQFLLRGEDTSFLAVTYVVSVAGDEFVYQLDGETLGRSSISNPVFDEAFKRPIREWIVLRVTGAYNNPERMPPEAIHFQELGKPHITFEGAKEAAVLGFRNIFAFVYDPSQNDRGRLNHGLMYFLQNQKTRKLIGDYFIPALFTLEELSQYTNVMYNLSMETSRWIILDPDLTVLARGIVHANPGDAEKLMLELAENYKVKAE